MHPNLNHFNVVTYQALWIVDGLDNVEIGATEEVRRFHVETERGVNRDVFEERQEELEFTPAPGPEVIVSPSYIC